MDRQTRYDKSEDWPLPLAFLRAPSCRTSSRKGTSLTALQRIGEVQGCHALDSSHHLWGLRSVGPIAGPLEDRSRLYRKPIKTGKRP